MKLKEMIPPMDEDRLVTLILIVFLAFGILGFAIIFVNLSDSDKEEVILSPPKIAELQLYDKGEKEPVALPDIETSVELADSSKEQPSAIPEPTNMPEIPEKKTAFPAPVTDKPESPPLVIIAEKDKANGSFLSAQEVSQGIIEGKRGTKEDKTDFYKIPAQGNTMTLTLEPFLDNKDQRFSVMVFDENKKIAGEINPEKSGPTISLTVEPQKTYYIMLDLLSAPIQSPQYKLQVSFD